MHPPAPTVEDRLRGEIKAEMARTGHTRQSLARLLDMSPWALGRRLNGETGFTFAEVQAVASALGLTTSELVRRSGEGSAA